MEHYGIWGIIPPLLTILLAFITKDVVASLFLGILSGALIISGGNPAVAIMKLTDLLAGSLADGWNIRIFLFCALLGGLVGMLTKTGASGAFGRWASNRLKTKKSSQFMTLIFGAIIFIDDYFNSLSVGTVMRPTFFILPQHPSAFLHPSQAGWSPLFPSCAMPKGSTSWT